MSAWFLDSELSTCFIRLSILTTVQKPPPSTIDGILSMENILSMLQPYRQQSTHPVISTTWELKPVVIDSLRNILYTVCLYGAYKELDTLPPLFILWTLDHTTWENLVAWVGNYQQLTNQCSINQLINIHACIYRQHPPNFYN